MKIKSLFINGFKNIVNQTLDFPDNLSYLTLIGLNGSGKSNYMEALSLIFCSYYKGKKDDIDFEYKLVYTLSDGKEYMLSNGEDAIDGNVTKLQDISLPTNVIACYSGESQRLWNLAYSESYEQFFNTAINNAYEEPKMLYVNKDVWTISLIALMCCMDSSSEIKTFLEEHFHITDLSEVKLCLSIDQSKLAGYKSNEVTKCLQRLSDGEQYMSSVASMDFDNGLNSGTVDFCRHLFFNLYLAYLPKKHGTTRLDAVITDIDIKIGDNISYKDISEGEKKLLLLECITKILGDKDSLLILDEPDSHVHIANKHLICQMCRDFVGQTVLSTHSPYVTNDVDFESLRFIASGEIQNIANIRTITNSMTDGSFDVLEGTMLMSNKRLIVTEGPYDIKYIRHAAKILGQDNPQYLKILSDISFVFQGGANEKEDYFNMVIKPILNQLDKVLFIFDVDADNNKNGQKGYKWIKSLEHNDDNKVDSLLYAESYPINDIDTLPPCYIEDFFPLSVELSTAIANFHVPLHFSEIKKANNISSSMKTNLKSKYKDYGKEDLNKFKPLLDEILRIFEL